MFDTQCLNQRRLSATTTFVCVASTVIGLLAGTLAALDYVVFYQSGLGVVLLGTLSGAGASLVVGIAWCSYMRRQLGQGGPRGLTRRGLVAGILAGIAATLVLHGILLVSIVLLTRPDLDIGVLFLVEFGLLCGVVAGLILGAVGGYLVSCCGSVAEPTLPPSTPPAPDSVSGTNEGSTHEHAN